MITESTIYWMTRLDTLCITITGLGITATLVAGIACIAALVVYAHSKGTMGTYHNAENEMKGAAWVFKVMLPILVLGLALLVTRAFVPTTKEYAAIKVIPAIANNEDVQKEAGEMYGLAKEWLKESAQGKE